MSIANLFRSTLTRISPRLNTEIVYFFKFKRPINLKNPKTLDEKIQWLKLNTYLNNPLVKQCADKYKVRNYVKECGCEEILNELYGSYNTVDEIPWDKLPNSSIALDFLRLNDIGAPGRVFKLSESAIYDYLENLEDITEGTLRWSEQAGIKNIIKTGEALSDKFKFEMLRKAFR